MSSVAHRVGRAGAGAGGTSCRHCGSSAGAQPRRPRHVAAVRDRPDRGGGRDGAVLPAPRPRVQACLLVQLPEYVPPDAIFTDYAYFSSYSDSWVEHARRYVEMIASASASARTSFVVEVASNDGYLLQHIVARGVPVLGIEPAANVAEVAVAAGRADARSSSSARDLARAAGRRGHARRPRRRQQRARPGARTSTTSWPGWRAARADGRASTLRVPAPAPADRAASSSTRSTTSTSRTSRSYARQRDLRRARARGRSTSRSCPRTAARCASTPGTPRAAAAGRRPRSPRCSRSEEAARAARSPATTRASPPEVEETKRALLDVSDRARSATGKTVVGYGAPGKGNTLLNYCGIRTDLLEYTVDRNPYKQGTFTPGTQIPILHPTSGSPRRGRTTS